HHLCQRYLLKQAIFSMFDAGFEHSFLPATWMAAIRSELFSDDLIHGNPPQYVVLDQEDFRL
ncbi:MAG: hypothetical protein ABEJ56_05670, partial [Candidatus Nanohaloarchaea archaeon]